MEPSTTVTPDVSHSQDASSPMESGLSLPSTQSIPPQGGSSADEGSFVVLQEGDFPIISVPMVPEHVSVVTAPEPSGTAPQVGPLVEPHPFQALSPPRPNPPLFTNGTTILPTDSVGQPPINQLPAGTTPAIVDAALPIALLTSTAAVAEPIVAETALLAEATNAAAGAASSLRDITHDIRDTAEHMSQVSSNTSQPPPPSTISSIPSSAGALQRALANVDEVALLPAPRRVPKRVAPPCEPQGIVKVKIGDNSITTTAITSTLAANLPISSVQDAADFVRIFNNRLPDMRSNFTYQAGQVSVKSTLFSCELGGRLGPGVDQINDVFRSSPAIIPPAQLAILKIKPGPSAKLGTIDTALLDSYMQGGNISERFVVSALQPKFGFASLPAVRALSEYITSSLEYCDNYLMYAKLYYQALLIDLIDEMQLNPRVTEFLQGDDPTFVNIDNPNLNYLDVASIIINGAITFVDRIDYTPDDLQLIYWLAKHGPRVTSVEAMTPYAVHVDWPAIPVAVLIHGDPPPVPAAVLVTRDRILGFIRRMASARGESAAAKRGLYLALDIIGVSYTNQAGQDGDRYHFILPNLSFHSFAACIPRDYNVLLRALHVRPVSDRDSDLEVSEWASITPKERVCLAAVYTATIEAFSTTVLYDYNLTHELLALWGEGDNMSPAAGAVIQKCSEPDRVKDEEPPLLTRIKDMFSVFLACSVPKQLYRHSSWLGQRGESQNCSIVFNQMQPNRPPYFCSPLSIDNWLLIRPMEWGISGPNTTLDIYKELVDVGSVANRGWRSVRGSTVYEERAASTLPVQMVVYGIQVLNAILNDRRTPAVPSLSFSQADWSPGHGVEWDRPQVLPHWQGHYIPGLFVMQPCTVMSYDYNEDRVLAPALIAPNAITDLELRKLSNWRGQEQPLVGFFQTRPITPSAPTSMMAALDLSSMFSPGAQAPAGAEAVNPQ